MRANYDSKGIHTGLAIGEIFATLENQFIINRKAIFQKAKKAASFRTAVFSFLDEYDAANNASTVEALKEVYKMASEELLQSQNVGITTVDKTIAHYKTQGYEPKLSLKPTISFSGILTDTLTALAICAVTAAANARKQLIQINALVDDTAPDIDAEIDSKQLIYLHQGIRTSNNVEMSADSERIIRDASHKILLAAEGERAAEYGLTLVQISAHPSCCPLCTPYQEKILIDDLDAGGVADGKHELLSTAKANGLFHWNCRHNKIVYIPGLSRPDFFSRDRQSDKKSAMAYAVEQEQRKNERSIREWKRVYEGAQSQTKRDTAKAKIAEWQARQRALSKTAKQEGVSFYRQYSREQIGGKTQPNLPKVGQRIYYP